MAAGRVSTAAVLAVAGCLAPQAGGAAAAEVRDPHGVAIVIGNRDYEEPGLASVEFALRDARAFKRYALDVLGYAPENVLVLENATRREMFRAFGRPNDPPGGPSTVRFRVDPGGRSDLVVFYSGHGAPGVDDGKGYLLPVDVPARAAQDEGYPVEALYRKLGALAAAEGRSAKSVRVFLDACFSGLLPGRRQLFVGASPAYSAEALPEGVGDGVTVLSAAGADQLANWDREARHGLFTHHLLDALYGGADTADYGDPDGVVTAAEAQAYLDDRMTWAAWDEYETEQTASLLGSAAAALSAAPPGGFPLRISAAPAEAEDALGLSRADWTAAQLGLGAAGFDPGPADGEANPRTRAALSSWQAAEGYGATGYLTRDQADALAAAGRAAAAEQEREEQARAERERAAREAADRDAFAAARSANTVAAFDEYLRSFPSGRHVDEARRLREEVDDGFAVGDVFRDCPHCPKMVVVPAGRFTMGSPASEEGRDDREGPQHEVTIGSKFAVGVYEVTFDEWDACVSGGGCGGYRPDDEGWGRGGRPVINVSWEDARAYAEWLSGETGESYRLLSESEWEYVARAGTVTRFWWGDSIGSNRVNCDGCGSRWDNKSTSPVGSFSANAFGLHDVHGNVWEWVEDCWNGSYDGAPGDGTAWEGGNCSSRVLRGGSWFDYPHLLRSADRHRDGAGNRYLISGFRVARTFTP